LNNFPEGVFKRYDIRGLYPEEIDFGFAYSLGRAFASYLKCRTVALGHDHRNGHEELFNGFSKGLVDQGCEVTYVGQISTDMIYFAVGSLGLDAGCMITASHNPQEWNGFKFVGKGAVGISSESGLDGIKELAKRNSFPKPEKEGRLVEKDILSEYVERVLSFIDTKKIKPMKVVVDASNGMASKAVSCLKGKLPIKIEEMFFDLDPGFPNHAPNPLDPEALEALKKRVVEEKADLGAIFDGDGDRVFLVDEKGQTIDGSILTCLIAKSFLSKKPGQKILYTPVMSHVVPETIKALGGKPVLERVGHTFIKVRMREENAVFGGELSGHFYFRDNYFADSGLIALVVALEALSLSGKAASETVVPYRKYFYIPETNSDVEDKDAKIAELEKAYSPKAVSTNKLDGFTAEFTDWWFNVRPSGTENKLRLNLEAKNPGLLAEKKKELLERIRG